MHRAARNSFLDIGRFIRAWVSNPFRIGAVAPSSSALAQVITSEINPDAMPVIELGAGTGVFTRALIERGIPEDRLVLVEYDPEFVRLLQSRFPSAEVLRMNASQLKSLELLGGGTAGAIVSGLPLLSMSPRQTMSILDGAFAQLRPSGAFYQFTYGPRCPVPRAILDRLGLKAVRIGGTFANLPPASVYRICRRQPRLALASRGRRQIPSTVREAYGATAAASP